MNWRQMSRQEKRDLINSYPLTEFYALEPSKYDFFVCPLCGSGTGKHSRYNGALRIKDNRVVCFACGKFSQGGHGSTDTLGALELILGYSENQVFDYCLSCLGGEDTVARPPTAKHQEHQVKRPDRNFEAFYEKAHRELFLFPGGLEYLRGRKISDDSIERFQIGYCDSWKHSRAGKNIFPTQNIIIPRTSRTYLARRIDGSGSYSKMVEGTQSDIFNLADLEKPVCFVVEGELDAISLIQAGAEGCVGICSTSNVNSFLELSRGLQSVLILALDNDASGREAQTRLYQGLREQGNKVLGFDPAQVYSGSKDANEAWIQNPDALKDIVKKLTKRGMKEYERSEVC